MEAAMIGNFLNLRGMVIVKIEPLMAIEAEAKGPVATTAIETEAMMDTNLLVMMSVYVGTRIFILPKTRMTTTITIWMTIMITLAYPAVKMMMNGPAFLTMMEI